MESTLLFVLALVLGIFCLVIGLYLAFNPNTTNHLLKEIKSLMATLIEAVAGVQASVEGVATAVTNVQSAVNQVLEDLRAGGETAAAIAALEGVSVSLGNVADSANAAADALKAADPTPPVE